jgi:hypothetical protein
MKKYPFGTLLLSLILASLTACGGGSGGSSSSNESESERKDLDLYYNNDTYTYEDGSYYHSTNSVNDNPDRITSSYSVNSGNSVSTIKISSGQTSGLVSKMTKPGIDMFFVIYDEITGSDIYQLNDLINYSITINVPDESATYGFYNYSYNVLGNADTITISNIVLSVENFETSRDFNRASVAGTVSVDFIDSENNEHSIATNYNFKSATDIDIHDSTGSELQGCWNQPSISTWCFDGNGSGQYIQYSVNGNPGTLTISFIYKTNSSTNEIETKNYHAKLTNSAFDYENDVEADWMSAEYNINVGQLTFAGGNGNWGFTTVDLSTLNIWSLFNFD